MEILYVEENMEECILGVHLCYWVEEQAYGLNTLKLLLS